MSVFSHKPGKPVTRREALSRAGNGFGMMAFASLLNTSILRAGISTPDGGGIMAYHGSPYSFDTFDTGKIGSGDHDSKLAVEADRARSNATTALARLDLAGGASL